MITLEYDCSDLNEKKRLLRSIFHVYEKNMKGETIPDLLDSIKHHRPVLTPKVDAMKELFSRQNKEGFLENGQSYRSSLEIYEHFKDEMKLKKQEEFWCIILDNKHRVIDKVLITLGTLNQSLVHPREVFAPAIEQRAAAVILMHNHPSGDPKPSNQDMSITKRLCQAGDLLGIRVLDSIVIGNNRYYSFVDEETMPV